MDQSRGTLVAVEGASAAGKTTAVAAAAKATGWTVVSEAYRRLRPVPSLEFRSPTDLLRLERKLLDEDARRYSEARRRTESGATVLADTGFFGPLTYSWGLVAAGAASPPVLRSLVDRARTLADRGKWGLADLYIYLDAPPAVRAARARSDPLGHPPLLAARHEKVGVTERRFYLERFAPLLGRRFRRLSGADRAARVAERVVDTVGEAPGPAANQGSIEAVLALFTPGEPAPRPARGNR
ncbi:MAG: AAA family ATPase [Thermoplasmata archaeon]